VARLVVLLLVPPAGPLTVAVNDSVFRRSGRKVYGAGWLPWYLARTLANCGQPDRRRTFTGLDDIHEALHRLYADGLLVPLGNGS
jgi:hypothetical protein